MGIGHQIEAERRAAELSLNTPAAGLLL